jgi:hypothetical protein
VLARIVSGGQTGVDRAAFEAARRAGLAPGGWCPRGRLAEDGPIPAGEPLLETPEADPAQRTAWNVRDSDATLVLVRGAPTGGTARALGCARAARRPHCVVDLAAAPDPDAVRAWLARERVRSLNVAGPRESEAPGIYAEALAFLARVLVAPAGGPFAP